MKKKEFKFVVLLILGPFLISPAGAGNLQAAIAQTPTKNRDRMWRRDPVVTIPFTLIHGIPFLKLRVNGQFDGQFMLDSGTARTLLNSDEAAGWKVKLSPAPWLHAKTLGEGPEPLMQAAYSMKLAFGGKIIVKGDMPAMSLSSRCAVEGMRISGILGYDVLRAHPAVLDYSNRRLMIFASNSPFSQVDPRAAELNIDPASVVPVIASPLAIDGKEYGTARTVLDTGAEPDVMVYARFAAQHSIDKLEGWKAGRSCAAGSFGSFMHGLRGSLVLGEENIMVPDVEVMMNQGGLAQSNLYDALVGSPVLERWSIVFDVAKGKIYLLDPNAHPVPY